MRFAVCDDMKVFVDSLELRICEVLSSRNISNIKTDKFTDGSSLIKSFQKNYYDAVFLDIDMPRIDGFTVATQIKEISPKTLIVFVTSCDNLVFDAIQIHPFSFLRKGHLENELEENILDILNEKSESNEVFVIKENSVIYNIPIEDIMYFESSRNMVIVHTKKTTYRHRESMIKLEKELQYYNFIRVHSGYLVNLSYVYSMEADEIMLKNSELIPVSRSYKKSVKEAVVKRLVKN